jgi:predicted signal transduction protein with EAL and GGDEF domain
VHASNRQGEGSGHPPTEPRDVLRRTRIVTLVTIGALIQTGMTRAIDADIARRALVRTFTTFGTEIGSMIIGEGVEKEREPETLRELGVTTAQSY